MSVAAIWHIYETQPKLTPKNTKPTVSGKYYLEIVWDSVCGGGRVRTGVKQRLSSQRLLTAYYYRLQPAKLLEKWLP